MQQVFAELFALSNSLADVIFNLLWFSPGCKKFIFTTVVSYTDVLIYLLWHLVTDSEGTSSVLAVMPAFEYRQNIMSMYQHFRAHSITSEGKV